MINCVVAESLSTNQRTLIWMLNYVSNYRADDYSQFLGGLDNEMKISILLLNRIFSRLTVKLIVQRSLKPFNRIKLWSQYDRKQILNFYRIFLCLNINYFFYCFVIDVKSTNCYVSIDHVCFIKYLVEQLVFPSEMNFRKVILQNKCLLEHLLSKDQKLFLWRSEYSGSILERSSRNLMKFTKRTNFLKLLKFKLKISSRTKIFLISLI